MNKTLRQIWGLFRVTTLSFTHQSLHFFQLFVQYFRFYILEYWINAKKLHFLKNILVMNSSVFSYCKFYFKSIYHILIILKSILNERSFQYFIWDLKCYVHISLEQVMDTLEKNIGKSIIIEAKKYIFNNITAQFCQK